MNDGFLSSPSLPSPPGLHASAADKRSVRQVMGMVLLALIPAVLTQIARIGVDLGVRLLLAIICALAVEALALYWRGRPLRPFLTDLSAPVAAVLFVLASPWAMPWWIACIGIIAALAVAKHVYGGLGDNPFNPAMFGCALLLICFSPYLQAVPVGSAATRSLPWVPMMYALGGLFLLWKKVIRWQGPVAMLGGAVATQLLYPSLVEEAFKGADLVTVLSAPVVLAAFFIVTDPVTGCLSTRGRIAFGAGAGALTVVFSRSGDAATGLPFAVLAMNCAASWIDRHTRPRRGSVPS